MNHLPQRQRQKRARRALCVLVVFVCSWLGWAGPLLVADRPACGMVCCLEGEGECCYLPGLELDADGSPVSGHAMRESVGAGCPPGCLLTAAPGKSGSRQGGLPVHHPPSVASSPQADHSRPIGAAIDRLHSSSIPRAPPADRSGYSTTA